MKATVESSGLVRFISSPITLSTRSVLASSFSLLQNFLSTLSSGDDTDKADEQDELEVFPALKRHGCEARMWTLALLASSTCPSGTPIRSYTGILNCHKLTKKKYGYYFWIADVDA